MKQNGFLRKTRMNYIRSKTMNFTRAFTMIELIFVIVVNRYHSRRSHT